MHPYETSTTQLITIIYSLIKYDLTFYVSIIKFVQYVTKQLKNTSSMFDRYHCHKQQCRLFQIFDFFYVAFV